MSLLHHTQNASHEQKTPLQPDSQFQSVMLWGYTFRTHTCGCH